MKKIFLLAALAVSALGANAQYYLGGSIGLGQTKINDVKTTVATIAPEFGYTFNKNWEAGFSIGNTSIDVEDAASTYTLTFNPYARYTAASCGPVDLFIEGGVNFTKIKDADLGFGIGLRPGLAVNLTKNWSFISKLGFLGYSDNGAGTTYTGFNFSTENVTFGVRYNF